MAVIIAMAAIILFFLIMAIKSKLNKQDISFLTNLIADITNELCECDCCKKEQGCSIFERVYVAGNILYKKVTEISMGSFAGTVLSLDNVQTSSGGITITTWTRHHINIFSDDSCIDWDTISQKINVNSSRKGRFVNKSRKKLLSRFYIYLWNQIGESGIEKDSGSENYVALTRNSIFTNADDVIANCLDECCNDTVVSHNNAVIDVIDTVD